MTHELPPTTAELGRPDWLVIGTPCPTGGVTIWASTELTHVEFEALIAEVRKGGVLARHRTEFLGYEFRGHLRRFVVAYGETYAEAMASLMGAWNPDQPDAPPGMAHLRPAQRALPSG